MAYRITGLDPAPFISLYGLADGELARLGIERHVVTQSPGFPDRVEVRDAEPGETVLLLNYEHQPVESPYRSRHAIFVREGARTARHYENTLPDALKVRLISLRAFDDKGAIIDADVAEGTVLEPVIARFFDDPRTAYLHAHFAKRGCFAARIDRA